MQTVEDILFVAHNHGIADEVFNEVGALKTINENKFLETNQLYYKAYQNVIQRKMNTLPETLEHKTWTSALIKSTTYDHSANTLTVEFNNEKIYDYRDFSPESYQEFLEAESKGKYFLSKIRAVYKDTPEKVTKFNQA
jgi:hypothetical protein